MMPLGPVVGGGGLNANDLKQKINMNVEHVIGRISVIAPQHISEEVRNCLLLSLSLKFCSPFRSSPSFFSLLFFLCIIQKVMLHASLLT